MTRLPLWPVLAAVAAGSCAAQSPSPSGDIESPEPQWKERHTPAAPLLWRATAPTGRTSYILGTIHVGVRAERLSPLVWQALGNSRVFVMEADVEAASASQANHGPPLSQRLSQPQLERLRDLLGEARAAALASSDAEGAYGAVLQALYPARASMDVELSRAAARRGAEVLYLEDWRQQLELGRQYFDVDELTELLSPNSQGRRELRQLIDAYRRGAIDEIEAMALADEEIDEDPMRFERLFFARNRNWVERAGPWMERRPCFIAVGVGHLPGERGLLRLLEDRGFAIERVLNPEP